LIGAKDGSMNNLDPTVHIDNEGQAYIFWGNSVCYYAKLKSTLVELDGPINVLDLPGFTEGASVHYRNGWYYLSYGYEFPEKLHMR
jgi:hypothetical protein